MEYNLGQFISSEILFSKAIAVGKHVIYPHCVENNGVQKEELIAILYFKRGGALAKLGN